MILAAVSRFLEVYVAAIVTAVVATFHNIMKIDETTVAI